LSKARKSFDGFLIEYPNYQMSPTVDILIVFLSSEFSYLSGKIFAELIFIKTVQVSDYKKLLILERLSDYALIKYHGCYDFYILNKRWCK
jgi:hypothetical protein